MKSKIAIVGCGWLGLSLAISLLKKGNTIIGTTTSAQKLPQLDEVGIVSKLWSFSQDINEDSLSFLDDIDILVLNIPPREKGSSFQYSQEIMKVCATLSQRTKVIFISTTSVYPDSLEIATEEYQFAESDLLKETVMAEVKSRKILGERLTILRLAGLIGENRHPIKTLAGREDVQHGNSPVNLIHQKDAIGLIEQIINKNCWGEVLNGCYPMHPTKEKYYKNAAIFFHLPTPKFLQNREIKKIVSSDKSQRLLSYEYIYSVDDFNLLTLNKNSLSQ